MNVGIYCGIKKSRAAKSGSAFRYSLIKLMIFSEVCLTCSARLRSRNEHQVSVRLLDRYQDTCDDLHTDCLLYTSDAADD